MTFHLLLAKADKHHTARKSTMLHLKNENAFRYSIYQDLHAKIYAS